MEKDARWSYNAGSDPVPPLAATVIALAALAGDVAQASAFEFPAATTTVIPSATAPSIAAFSGA